MVDPRGSRLFVGGGEPLCLPWLWDALEAASELGFETVLCTSGEGLDSDANRDRLLHSGASALSVSLDSFDSHDDDNVRRLPDGGSHWTRTTDGLRTLVRERRSQGVQLAVGVYMVVTKQNVGQIAKTHAFARELGADYFVFQPVSIPAAEPCRNRYVLTAAEASVLSKEVDSVLGDENRLVLPSAVYLDEFVDSIRGALTAHIEICPCRSMLTFIRPDGSTSECPWAPMTASVAASKTDDSQVLPMCAGMPLSDCVNMRVLCEFDEVLEGVKQRREVR